MGNPSLLDGSSPNKGASSCQTSSLGVDPASILALALERCTSMVVVAAMNGEIQWVNQRFCQVTGYDAADVIGRHTRILSSGSTATHTYQSLWQSITAGRPWTGEFHNRRKDGSLHWVAATISPIHDGQGIITGFLAIEDDITESKATRDALQRTEQRLVTALEAIDDGFALFDSDERLELCNERYRATLGAADPFIEIGMRYEDILREGLQRHLYADVEDPETWLVKRMEIFRAGDRQFEQHLTSDIWVRASERKTADGGRVALRTDITALKRAQHDLLDAKQAADAANRAKSTFLSNMSHELRTPLNAILGFGQMLRLHPSEQLSPLQDQCVGNILEAGEHLLHLINEILDLARIEAGRMELTLEPVPLHALSEECLDMLHPQAEARSITLINDLGSDDCLALADPFRLKQVLVNLIGNAIKYNRDHGRVTLRARPDGDFCQIDIIDSGIGISPEMQTRLFTPFDRLGVEAQHTDGTGIGLAITRHLIELMGGAITCQSAAGEGSTFRIILPAPSAPSCSKD